MKAGKNQQVVMRLIDAVSENDKERIQSFLGDDTVLYVSTGEKKVGQKAIWDLMSVAHNRAEKVDWQVDQLVEDESGRVITRGCLRYLADGQWNEIPVNGAFEVKGSKIIQWC